MERIEQIAQLMIGERDKLNRAIAALTADVKRRGRPPKNPLAAPAPVVEITRPGRPRGWTAAQRAHQAKKMKAYWAKRKRAA